MQSSDHNLITIAREGMAPERMSPGDMARLAGGVFDLSTRVPGAEGEAFDWAAWHDGWRRRRGLRADGVPTHLKVEAADGFEALIPWEQLREAAVLVAVNGAPLAKGAPARLYVPNGTSACLNVKSVVAFRLLYGRENGGEASYGFKSTFAPNELRKP